MIFLVVLIVYGSVSRVFRAGISPKRYRPSNRAYTSSYGSTANCFFPSLTKVSGCKINMTSPQALTIGLISRQHTKDYHPVALNLKKHTIAYELQR